MTFVIKRDRLGELLFTAGQVALIVRRYITAGAALAAVVFIALSCQNPEWSYEFVWLGGISSFAHGWLYPLEVLKQHPYATATLLVAGFGGALFRRRHCAVLIPQIERSWAWLSGAAAVSIMVTSLIVYGLERDTFESLEETDATFRNIIASAEHELSPRGRPDIKTPIDFEYVDRGHVEALYNQIQQELPVTRQTIEDSTALKGRVDVDTPALTGEIGKTKNKNSSASFERIQFLPERQCIEVMKYVLNEGTARYYTTAEDWHLNRLIRQLQESREAAKGPVTKANWEKFRSPTIDEDQKASEKDLHDQLSTLDGLVFISGQVFENHQTEKDSVLTWEFAKKPQHIVFRVNLDSGAKKPDLVVEKETRLTVFGRITKPLGTDGIIDVHPLAIF
jgi:hypothetical protein